VAGVPRALVAPLLAAAQPADADDELAAKATDPNRAADLVFS